VKTRKRAGQLGRNPLDVAFTPDGSRAYVANAGSNSVSVINTGTNTLIATVAVGARPLNVAITPDGASSYVADAAQIRSR
jgi:YVTN family beta-propeller protein